MLTNLARIWNFMVAASWKFLRMSYPSYDLRFVCRTLMKKIQPVNLLTVEFKSSLTTLVSFPSRMALLVIDNFYNIESQREGLNWDPWTSQEAPRCKFTHQFSQNTKVLKKIVFFPKRKRCCDVLQEKLVQVYVSYYWVISLLRLSLKIYHRLGVLSNRNSFSLSSWG